MSQLVKRHSAITLDTENLPKSPAITEDFGWNSPVFLTDDVWPGTRRPRISWLGTQKPLISWSGTQRPPISETDPYIAVENRQEVFLNAVRDALQLPTPDVHYTVAPFVKKVELETQLDEWNVAEQTIPSITGNRFAIMVLGAASTEPDQERLVSGRSTAVEDSSLLLQRRLAYYFDRLVQEATDEVFYDGMESTFSRGLSHAVQAYGYTAVNAIDKLLSQDRTNAEAAGEILRQVGSIEDPRTHYSRLAMLTNWLQSPDPRIRDAASLGLASLDDPLAIDSVRRALNEESSHQLQKNLRLVLNQLQST